MGSQMRWKCWKPFFFRYNLANGSAWWVTGISSFQKNYSQIRKTLHKSQLLSLVALFWDQSTLSLNYLHWAPTPHIATLTKNANLADWSFPLVNMLSARDSPYTHLNYAEGTAEHTTPHVKYGGTHHIAALVWRWGYLETQRVFSQIFPP